MIHHAPTRAALLGALAIATVALVPSLASAGECPADKVLRTPRVIETVTDDSKLKGEVINTLDPSGWRGMKGLMLRTRRLTIAPGGYVPTHSHADRPALIYFVSGEITEHSTVCSVPIVHKPGESIAEFGAGVQHWWQNTGTVPVVLISSDLVPIEMMNDRMMQMP